MAKNKESALRCVIVLTVIAVVCGVLLAVLNPLLYVAPSANDISDYFTLEVENSGEWEVVELDSEFAGKTSDPQKAAVNLVAKMTNGSETYIGLLITTRASGNLAECKFVMFFTQSNNSLVDAKMTLDGSTGGKYSYEEAILRAGANGKKFEDYYGEITKADQFDGSYVVPSVGATLTLSAVDNAFKKAAYYYYNVFGGEVK